MQPLSIFDIFKIGVGPSSSHTLGPWKAALRFSQQLAQQRTDKVCVHLFGSLSKTGRGHATDIAVTLGLQGYEIETIATQDIPLIVKEVNQKRSIKIGGDTVAFNPSTDIVFGKTTHTKHPNTLILRAYLEGQLIRESIVASVGGGFTETEGEQEQPNRQPKLPFPIQCGKDIIMHTDKKDSSISAIVLENEGAFRNQEDVLDSLDNIAEAMIESVYEGCQSEGVLPGGLGVHRRAKKICDQLLHKKSFSSRGEWMRLIQQTASKFNLINNWVSCFALAVNEQNASMNRVVTSPTNGAAGVIPATLLYYYIFCQHASTSQESIRRFLSTAGEIGCLFKKGATISAAVGGCQAEIGVSSAMAAAGLTEVLGGTPRQCLMAAEIAMEHHLGLTCDPVGGLVQVPCIERNAMGATKAITAANLALVSSEQTAVVKLDTVIKTMWNTAQDMHHKYKETAEGGLAFNIPVSHADC